MEGGDNFLRFICRYLIVRFMVEICFFFLTLVVRSGFQDKIKTVKHYSIYNWWQSKSMKMLHVQIILVIHIAALGLQTHTSCLHHVISQISD